MVLLSKLAIIDPATGDTVVLSNVAEGGEGATRQGFSIEPVAVTLENEQLYWPKANYRLQMAGLRNASQKAQLDAWVGEELTFSGYGTDTIFQGTGKLNADPAAGEEVATWRIEAAKQAVRGYGSDGRAHSRMILCENGFAEYLWGDADSDGIADGWSKTGTGTLTFTGGAQTMEADEGTVAIEREIYFPFAGRQLTFRIDVDSYTNAANLTRNLEMEYLDSAGATLSTDSETFTGTGVKSITTEVPDSTHSIAFRVEITETGTGAASITFSNAQFRLGTSTEYIAR